MLLGALSTDHKIGLAAVGGTFILFALVSSFLIPRYRPQYPGRQGLPIFLLLSIALFAGMMSAVVFFGREAKEAKGGESVSTSKQTNPGTTNAGVSAPIPVTETEFKIKLNQKTFKEGGYRFQLKNAGKLPHNLTVKGPGITRSATPTIAGGQTAALDVALQKGTYELYCSVPGHKQAGMDIKIKVT